MTKTELDFAFKIFHLKNKSLIATSVSQSRNYQDVLIETMVEDWVRYD